MGWDVNLPEVVKQRWVEWLTNLPKLQGCNLTRCIKPPDFGHPIFAQLHHFADASEDAYGTASYLLLKNERNQVSCTFMIGKARVAPLKQPTIPRIELTAATVAVKMDKLLRKELQLDLVNSVFWIDSTAVLIQISPQ